MLTRSTPTPASPTNWSVLDRDTGRLTPIAPHECFPIAGRLVSAVWELDDGRVLLASTQSAQVPHP